MQVRTLFFFMSLSSFAITAQAISLPEALSKLRDHPQWLAAQAVIEQANAERQTAQQYVNPTLELSSETHDRQTLGIAFPLETPNVRQYRQQSADQGILYAVQQAQLVQQQLRASVRQKYYRILQAQEESLLSNNEVALLAQLRNAVQLKVQVGEAPKYEGVKAEAEWLTSLARQQNAEQQLKLAQQQFTELLGLDSVKMLSVSMLDDSQICKLPQSNNVDLSDNPSLKSAQASLSKEQANMHNEEALVTPQPTLLLGTEHELGIERVKVGVSFPLPLFNQRDGQIAAAKAKTKQAEALVHAVDRQLKQDWSRAYMRFQNADLLVKSYESGLLKAAESAFQVAQSAYKYGERSILELIDAQRTLATIKRTYLANQFERRYACIDMLQLTEFGED